jgi:hypothetical protein
MLNEDSHSGKRSYNSLLDVIDVSSWLPINYELTESMLTDLCSKVKKLIAIKKELKSELTDIKDNFPSAYDPAFIKRVENCKTGRLNMILLEVELKMVYQLVFMQVQDLLEENSLVEFSEMLNKVTLDLEKEKKEKWNNVMEELVQKNKK